MASLTVYEIDYFICADRSKNGGARAKEHWIKQRLFVHGVREAVRTFNTVCELHALRCSACEDVNGHPLALGHVDVYEAEVADLPKSVLVMKLLNGQGVKRLKKIKSKSWRSDHA